MPKRTRATELKEYLGRKQAFALVHSEALGLYDEMDKLCKKAPSEMATALQVNVVNRFIERAKQLLQGDPIIDDVTAFVPAGDNPEYRDVLTVLRQITQGLQRFEGNNSYLWDEGFEEELAENDIEDTDAISLWK